MRKILGLIFVGLVIAGWINRDKLGGLTEKAETALEEASSTLGLAGDAPQPSAAPVATPHPAAESQAQATVIYPGLARRDSALNKKFVALYKEAQLTDPAFLSRPDWPLQLADRAMIALGGGPMPRKTAAVATQARPDKQVVMYTTSHCPYCVKAKQYLTKKGIRFQEIDIDRSTAGKEAYKKLGGSGVPLIMVGTTKVQGFSETTLDRLLL